MLIRNIVFDMSKYYSYWWCRIVYLVIINTFSFVKVDNKLTNVTAAMSYKKCVRAAKRYTFVVEKYYQLSWEYSPLIWNVSGDDFLFSDCLFSACQVLIFQMNKKCLLGCSNSIGVNIQRRKNLQLFGCFPLFWKIKQILSGLWLLRVDIKPNELYVGFLGSA